MVRTAKPGDREAILRLYESAREYMHTHGNPTQWVNGYPAWEVLSGDIARGELYVLWDESGIYGVFLLTGRGEPTYGRIHGRWHSDGPYGTIHRICGDGVHRGIAAEACAFAGERFDCLRADTHENNLPMQRALVRLGFRLAGVIRLKNGERRLAYDLVVR